MNWKAFWFAVLLCLPGVAFAEQVTTYDVAHVRHRDSNMVFVVTDSSFFDEDLETQQKWYTALKVCVRSVNMKGQTIVVAESDDDGRLLFYGPKNWHKFLRTLDMEWVTARVNKELTCHY